MVKAATYLSRPNVLFLATNDDVTTPQSDPAILPGLLLFDFILIEFSC